MKLSHVTLLIGTTLAGGAQARTVTLNCGQVRAPVEGMTMEQQNLIGMPLVNLKMQYTSQVDKNGRDVGQYGDVPDASKPAKVKITEFGGVGAGIEDPTIDLYPFGKIKIDKGSWTVKTKSSTLRVVHNHPQFHDGDYSPLVIYTENTTGFTYALPCDSLYDGNK